ncbi:hypothetical protein JXO52_17930 [bacterium]|nr:hypothetical protein [bacterium]
MKRVLKYIRHMGPVHFLLVISACTQVKVPISALEPDTVYFCLNRKLFLCPACVQAVEQQCAIVTRLAKKWPVIGIVLNDGEDDDRTIRIIELQINGFAKAHRLPYTFRYDRGRSFGNRSRIVIRHADEAKFWKLPLSAQELGVIINFMSG